MKGPEAFSESGAGDPLVLCYHAVSERWPALLSVTPEQFEFQIGLLASQGYEGVTFTDAVLGRHNGKVAAVTFDDGYRSVIELARPILERHGMKATVFVPTSFVDIDEPMAWSGIDQWLDGPHEYELMPMAWQQLRELQGDGWEIGSHTRTHPRLSTIDDEQLRVELEGSRAECAEQLGSCSSVAYPYGDFDERALRVTEAAGYAAAATLPSRLAQPSPIAFPRVGVYHTDTRRSFRIKVSPAVRRLRKARAWTPIAKMLRSVRSG